MYRNIQGMRAIAALMVFAVHVFWPIVPMRYHWAFPYADAIGPAGVDIFFVISGFIIYTVATRMGAKAKVNGRLNTFWEFAAKRLIRIYPIYWIVFAVASLVLLFIDFIPPGIEHKPLLRLLLLLDQPNDRVLAAWTLNFEMYFYAVAAIVLLLVPRHVFAGLMSWFGAVLLVIVAAFILHKEWMFWVPFAAIIFEFMLGILVAALIQRGITTFAVGSIAIGVFSFLVGAEVFRVHGGWMQLPSWWRLACFGVPSAFIIYAMVAFEARGSWTFPAVFQKLGDASYSIYLWHQLVFAVLAAAFTRLGLVDVVPRTLLALGLLAAGIGVGVLSYHYLEKPIIRVLGKLLLERKARAATSGSIAPSPASD